MTTKTDYTAEEWHIISKALANTIYVVLMVDYASIEEIYQEQFIIYNGIDIILAYHNDNELLMAMDQEGDDLPDPDDVQVAMQELRSFVAIVDAKATPAEAQDFKAFLYEIAHNVASAYVERDGRAISDKEEVLLSELRTVFGLPE